MSFHQNALAALAACMMLGASIGTADAADRKVTIKNDTSSDFSRLYVRAKGTKSWGKNLFGSTRLSPQDSIVIELKDGSSQCIFDFKADYYDGESQFKMKWDACKRPTLTLN